VLQRYGDAPIEHTVSATLVIDSFELTIAVLFDTGALQGNYLSGSVADWMRRHGAEAAHSPSRICSAFNECQLINNLFNCHIVFNNIRLDNIQSLASESTLVPYGTENDDANLPNRKRPGDGQRNRAKRRKLLKMDAVASFSTNSSKTLETPEGTTRTMSCGTWETPEGTNCPTAVRLNEKTGVTFVHVDLKELEIPHDVIIGKPDNQQYLILKLIRNYV